MQTNMKLSTCNVLIWLSVLWLLSGCGEDASDQAVKLVAVHDPAALVEDVGQDNLADYVQHETDGSPRRDVIVIVADHTEGTKVRIPGSMGWFARGRAQREVEENILAAAAMSPGEVSSGYQRQVYNVLRELNKDGRGVNSCTVAGHSVLEQHLANTELSSVMENAPEITSTTDLTRPKSFRTPLGNALLMLAGAGFAVLIMLIWTRGAWDVYRRPSEKSEPGYGGTTPDPRNGGGPSDDPLTDPVGGPNPSTKTTSTRGERNRIQGRPAHARERIRPGKKTRVKV
jgi:hypothetical protein